MSEDGGLTIRLSKLTVGVATTIIAALIVAAVANLWSLNVGMNSLLEWKRRSEDSSLPRSEWALEKQLLQENVEQLRARIVLLERDRH